jgi:hypothetical protein
LETFGSEIEDFNQSYTSVGPFGSGNHLTGYLRYPVR